MKRNLWVIMLSIALMGQTMATALPVAPCSMSATVVEKAAIDDDRSHHQHMTTFDEFSEDSGMPLESQDQRDCCDDSNGIGCSMSSCLSLVVLPPASLFTGGVDGPSEPAFFYSVALPQAPAFLLFRPPIA